MVMRITWTVKETKEKKEILRGATVSFKHRHVVCDIQPSPKWLLHTVFECAPGSLALTSCHGVHCDIRELRLRCQKVRTSPAAQTSGSES
eukprot:2413783-Amphidinium_carterae.1